VALVASLAIIGLSLAWWAVAYAQADGRVESKLAELRAAGQPTSLAELARKPPLPEQNAATYLRRAKDYVDSIDKEVSAAYENETEDDQEAIDRGRPTPRFVEAIRSALAAYPKTIPLLKQAADCPDYDAQLNYEADTKTFMDELNRQIQLTRASMRNLNYRATLQIADGDLDGAIDTCLTTLRLCRHFDREPTIIGGLVAVACRGIVVSTIDLALRSGDVSDATCDALDAELKRHDVAQVYRQSLISDRAFGLAVLAEVAAGKHREQLRGNDAYWFRAVAFKDNELGYLDYMAQSLAIAGRPYADVIDDECISKALASAGPFADLAAPNTRAALVAVGRAEAAQRALVVLNRIQRFEKANPGHVPSLADLSLPPEITTDPFNGRPLKMHKEPGGWLIYSVGHNLKDDGGKVVDIDDCGFGPLPRIRGD
jgi:hypothetical protein